MKFLNRKSKKKYMKDFNENVLTCEHEYWGVDSEIRDVLIEINKNSQVQTLYSKYDGSIMCWSYLFLSVTKEFYPKLKDIVKEFNSKISYFRYDVIEPSIHVNNEVEMGCNTDKEHFNTSVFCFACECHDENTHELFWGLLQEKFAN